MKLSKFFAIPALALSVCLVGCTPSGDTTVIEQEQISEAEMAKMDEDYDAQYAEEAEEYARMEEDGTER